MNFSMKENTTCASLIFLLRERIFWKEKNFSIEVSVDGLITVIGGNVPGNSQRSREQTQP